MCHFVHICFFLKSKLNIRRRYLCRYMNTIVKNVTRSLNIWFLVPMNQPPALPARVKK